MNTLEALILETPIISINMGGGSIRGRYISVKKNLSIFDQAKDTSSFSLVAKPRDMAIITPEIRSYLQSMKGFDGRSLLDNDTLWIPQDHATYSIQDGQILMWLDAPAGNGPYVYRHKDAVHVAKEKFKKEFRFLLFSSLRANHLGFKRVESLEGPFKVVAKISKKMGNVILADNNWGDGPQQILTEGGIIRFKKDSTPIDFYGIDETEIHNYK